MILLRSACLMLSLIIVIAGRSMADMSVTTDWGGQMKAVGRTTFPKDGSLQEAHENDPWFDGSLGLRIKNRTFFTPRIDLNTHYEAVYFAGDTRESQLFNQALLTGFPGIGSVLQAPDNIEDDQRLFDLTKVVSDDDDEIFYHRLDRLCLTWQPDWGRLAIGRQAVTWGNGLLFNPMDLFNPFSPSDIDRDYKVGGDMVNLEVRLGHSANMQVLYVPRHDLQTRDVENDCSSLAANVSGTLDGLDVNFMLASHYEDTLAGLGVSGYLGGAVWRTDVIYTAADSDLDEDFWSMVANLDYSWLWLGKNAYGFIEVYYTTLGTGNYLHKYTDADIFERLARGEMFTAGRLYISPHIQWELHPLLNVFLTVTVNAEDPSGYALPRAVWDFKDNLQLTFGGNVYFGGGDTEFGGVDIIKTPLLKLTDEPGSSVFCWLTWFF